VSVDRHEPETRGPSLLRSALPAHVSPWAFELLAEAAVGDTVASGLLPRLMRAMLPKHRDTRLLVTVREYRALTRCLTAHTLAGRFTDPRDQAAAQWLVGAMLSGSRA
jgi:hypothetical protein